MSFPPEPAPPLDAPLDASQRELANPWRSIPVRMVAFLAACYLLLRLAAPYLPMPRGGALAISTVVFAFLMVTIAYHTSRARLSLREQLGAFLAFAGLWAVFAFVLGPRSSGSPLAVTASEFCFLFACIFFGTLLSRIFRDKNILLPVCLAAALVDVASVYYGPTGKAVEHAPGLFRTLSVSVPAMGANPAAPGQAAPSPVAIGIGDLVFLAAFFAAAARFHMNPRRTFWIITPLVVLGLLVVVLAPEPVKVPGLVFIGGGFLWANFREFDLTPGERWAMLYAALVIVVVLGLCSCAARFM